MIEVHRTLKNMSGSPVRLLTEGEIGNILNQVRHLVSDERFSRAQWVLRQTVVKIDRDPDLNDIAWHISALHAY